MVPSSNFFHLAVSSFPACLKSVPFLSHLCLIFTHPPFDYLHIKFLSHSLTISLSIFSCIISSLFLHLISHVSLLVSTRFVFSHMYLSTLFSPLMNTFFITCLFAIFLSPCYLILSWLVQTLIFSHLCLTIFFSLLNHFLL